MPPSNISFRLPRHPGTNRIATPPPSSNTPSVGSSPWYSSHSFANWSYTSLENPGQDLLQYDLENATERVKSCQGDRQRAWYNVASAYRQRFPGLHQLPHEGCFAAWALANFDLDTLNHSMDLQFRHHWKSLRSRTRGRVKKIVAAYSLPSRWIVYLYLGPRVIDEWSLQRPVDSFSKLLDFAVRCPQRAFFRDTIYPAVLIGDLAQDPPIHSGVRGKPQLEEVQLCSALDTLLQPYLRPGLSQGNTQHSDRYYQNRNNNAVVIDADEEETDSPSKGDDLHDPREKSPSDESISSQGHPPPNEREQAEEGSVNAAQHEPNRLSPFDLPQSGSDRTPEDPPSSLYLPSASGNSSPNLAVPIAQSAPKQDDESPMAIPDINCIEAQIAQVEGRERFTENTIDTYIQHIVRPMYPGNKITWKTMDFWTTIEPHSRSTLRASLAPLYSTRPPTPAMAFQASVNESEMESELTYWDSVDRPLKGRSITDDMELVAIPARHDEDHWFLITIHLHRVSNRINIAIWDHHEAATLVYHLECLESLMDEICYSLQGWGDWYFQFVVNKDRLVQQDSTSSGIYLLENATSFAQDPLGIFDKRRDETHQPAVSVLREMIHDNLTNYWKGVKLMLAHQTLCSDTARHRRALENAIGAKDLEDSHGVEAGVSQLALQRHKKRVAQDEIDQRDARRRRKQDVLDEMHGMENIAQWENRQDGSR